MGCEEGKIHLGPCMWRGELHILEEGKMEVPRFFSQGPHSSLDALSHTEAVFNQKVKMRKSGILSKCYIRRGELGPKG